MVRALIFSLALCVLVVPVAHAQTFLELIGQSQGPIPGGATFPGEEGHIEVFSLGFGLNASGAGGGGSLQISASSITFTKQWDSASIKLARALANQEPLDVCVFKIYVPGGGAAIDGAGELGRRMPMPYEMRIELVDARVESHSLAASDVSPFENLSIVFHEIRIEHGPSLNTFAWARPTAPRLATPGLPVAGAAPRMTSDPLEFELPMTGNVTIDVVDAEGRSVRCLLFGDVSEYDGRIVWDATDDAGRRVAPGLYVATQRMEGRDITRRIVIGR